MRVIDIAMKDLLEIVRDKKSLLFLVLMPVVFTLFMGVAFRVSDEQGSRLPVGWVDADPEGSLAPQLRALLASTAGIEVLPLSADEAARVDEQVQNGNLAAAVIVPPGWSAQALSQAPGDGALPLTVVVPETQAGQTVTTALQAAAARLLGAAEAARLSVEAVDARAPFPGESTRKAAWQAGLAEAGAAWEQPALSVALQPATNVPATQAGTPAGFLQSSPGMMVQFAVFSLVTSAMVLVMERKSGALGRLLTTPVRRLQVLAGHLLAMFLVVLLQSLLLVALGQLALGVDYGREPLGTLLMLVALAFWVTSLGLLVGTLAKGEEQVIVFSMIAMVFFAALGGAWFPLEFAGPTFSVVGHLTPTAWAMDGLQNIIVRGQDLGSVLLPAGVLLGYALAFLLLATWRFRWE
jgi:ABC-2 type transport system permease protein